MILILAAQICFIVVLSIFKAKKKLNRRESNEEQDSEIKESKKRQKKSKPIVLESLKFSIDPELTSEESVESLQPVRV